MHDSRRINAGTFIYVIAPALVLSAFSCQPRSGAQLTEEQARAIIERYRDARNTGDLELLDEIYASDVIVHDAGAPEDIQGLEALKSYYEASHAGFPDFEIRFHDVLVAEEHIISRWTIDASHTDTLRGIPPTGQHVTFSGVAIDRIRDGEIVEEWVYFNLLDLFEQLGIAPPPPTGAAAG